MFFLSYLLSKYLDFHQVYNAFLCKTYDRNNERQMRCMNERQSTIDQVSKQAFCSICFIGFGGLKTYIQDMFEILRYYISRV